MVSWCIHSELLGGWSLTNRERNGRADRRVAITAVTAGGPAAQAGLKTGDVITAVNGISLKDEDC